MVTRQHITKITTDKKIDNSYLHFLIPTTLHHQRQHNLETQPPSMQGWLAPSTHT